MIEAIWLMSRQKVARQMLGISLVIIHSILRLLIRTISTNGRRIEIGFHVPHCPECHISRG
jgi:hypothetical protein